MRLTLNILGYTFAVREVDDDEVLATGRMIGMKQRLLIAKDQTEEQQISTVLHEVLEAIDWLLKVELDERKICCLEVALYQVLTANGVDLTPLIREEK